MNTANTLNQQVTNVPEFNSVWDALADTPEAATNLRLRSELMRQINALIESQDLTQTQAAKQCGITQPRMNDLLRGKISRFSLDALVNIATAAGCVVHLELEAA
jgi:predicted XRE-type DNA-binding protein